MKDVDTIQILLTAKPGSVTDDGKTPNRATYTYQINHTATGPNVGQHSLSRHLVPVGQFVLLFVYYK